MADAVSTLPFATEVQVKPGRVGVIAGWVMSHCLKVRMISPLSFPFRSRMNFSKHPRLGGALSNVKAPNKIGANMLTNTL